eukprot:SAG11_NODE_6003_length_1412_cov_1.342727_2_plen_251_part_01
MRDFFAELTKTSATIRNMSAQLKRPTPLKLAVDAGTGWVCPQPSSFCPGPYCGCRNITFNGETKSVASHVVDISDEIVLMDYLTSPQSVYSAALPILQYADTIQKPRCIRVGVAIHSPTGNNNSYEVPDESALAALFTGAEVMLRLHPSFAGFAVFAAWWHDSSMWKPVPAGTRWPRGTGVWYSNHSMILDPDTSTRDAWLAWAESRGITEVYIAPHAPTPLIEGSSGGDDGMMRFCDFLAVGSRHSLEVQ